MHCHLSISTKVLLFWRRLRGSSHLVAGRVRGRPTSYLSLSGHCFPHGLPCLPAAQCTAVGFLSIPFHFSVHKVSTQETWQKGYNLVHRDLLASKGRRVCTTLVLGNVKLHRSPRMSSKLLGTAEDGDHPSLDSACGVAGSCQSCKYQRGR